MLNSPIEEQLLLCCARMNINNEIRDRIKILISQEIDWDEVIDLTVCNQVVPLVYRNLQSIKDQLVPSEVINQLREINIEIIAFSMSFAIKLQEILQCFHIENIPVIPYKGSILASAVYGDICLRQFSDIDLFVASQDIFRSRKLLISQGYQFNREFQWEQDFTHPDTDITIDLHQAMAQSYYPFRLSFEHCIKNAQDIKLLDNMVPTFDTIDLLLVLSIQLTKDSYGQTCTLTKVCDMSELICRYPTLEWKEVLERATSIGCQRLLLLSLLLTHKLLGTDLPQNIWELIKKDWVVKEYGKLLAIDFFYPQTHSVLHLLFKVLILIEYPLSANHNIQLLKNMASYIHKKLPSTKIKA
jgi:Uncharacterised nucleotidyltransferase